MFLLATLVWRQYSGLTKSTTLQLARGSRSRGLNAVHGFIYSEEGGEYKSHTSSITGRGDNLSQVVTVKHSGPVRVFRTTQGETPPSFFFTGQIDGFWSFMIQNCLTKREGTHHPSNFPLHLFNQASKQV